MKQVELARQVVERLAAAGVLEFVLCPGARNAPLVSALAAAKGLQVYSFFEERSAGFFALGRIQASGRPVAVVTTSGTAVAELLPAMIEADYQGLPLVALTADRPKSHRGCGSPQAIVQPGIFSHYVGHSYDLEAESPSAFILEDRPVHVNVCFDEPLLDTPLADFSVSVGPAPVGPSQLSPAVSLNLQRPLIVVGGLAPIEAQKVFPFLENAGRPIYLEGPSQLRGHAMLKDLEVVGGPRSLKRIKYDGVIRIGSVPTVRLWRDLESSAVPVWNFARQRFSGLARVREVHPLEALPNHRFDPWDPREREDDRLRGYQLEELLRKFPDSEPGFVNWISRNMPAHSQIFVGNSLPVREWDLAAARDPSFQVFANRGVNGIDGLISSFIGSARADRSNWALIGDLSALYDLAGLWAAGQGSSMALNLVVLNNGGGKIFERMFRQPLFENRHGLDFKGWAEMFGWNYQKIDSAQDILTLKGLLNIVEVVPSERSTHAFWDEWEKP